MKKPQKLIHLVSECKKLIRSPRYRWIFWYKNFQPLIVSDQKTSNLPIDVVILAIEKDLPVLPYVIDGVRRNIKHPISQIFVVSPVSEKIQKLCSEKDCEFIDERSLIDVTPENLKIVIDGVDRSKWYYQQFLKWSGDIFTHEGRYLIIDADTVFIRPQVFETNGKVVFNFSDEYHKPYYELYTRLLHETIKCPVSFTSHQMLFENNFLQEVKNKIEEINGCKWYEAIIKNIDRHEQSGSSDYETYGQYVFLHHRSKVHPEYWFNLSLKREDLEDLDVLEQKYKSKYKSISFHSWNKKIK